MIIVNIDELIINRTLKYLVPALVLYGKEFIAKLNSLKTLAVGIGDQISKHENCIYILFDVNGKRQYGRYIDIQKAKKDFKFMLTWLREQPFYVQDYPYDSGTNGHQHMVVLKLPIENLVMNFLKGNYSKLYTKHQIENFFAKKDLHQYFVLKKDVHCLQEYIEILKSEYGVNLTIDDVFHHKEYDIPPNLNEEIFN